MTGEENGTEPVLRRWGVREIVQSAIGLALAACLLVFGLPRVADTTWPEILALLRQVPPLRILIMGGLTLTGLYCYTYTLTGSLPGLSHLRALMVNAAGSMVSNVLPMGGPLGVALTYAMFRSWSFTRRAISTALVVTSVWNLMTRLALPVLAVLVVVFGPVDVPDPVMVGAAIGAAVGGAVLGLFVLVIFSDTVSHAVGTGLGRFLGLFSQRVRSGRALDQLIQDQRERTETIVRRRGAQMTLGLAGMFSVFFVLYVVAARTVGLDLSVAHLFTAYAFRQLLTVVAITPGGLGVTEVGTAGVLVSFGAEPAAASATALLYAIFTHVLEVPLGLLAWFGWTRGRRRRAAREVAERAQAQAPSAASEGS